METTRCASIWSRTYYLQTLVRVAVPIGDHGVKLPVRVLGVQSLPLSDGTHAYFYSLAKHWQGRFLDGKWRKGECSMLAKRRDVLLATA